MKKVLIGLGIIGVAYAMFGTSKKDDATQTTTTTTTAAVGFNADGTPRALTAEEVKSYLLNNTDLAPAYTNGLGTNVPTDWTLEYWANWHWQNYGYNEHRTV